jgi:putative membrane protein
MSRSNKKFGMVLGLLGMSGSLLGLFGVALGQHAAKPSLGDVGAADRRFLREATERGIAAVELGRMAVRRSSDDNVRRLGQRMIEDHGKANEQIQRLATSKSVALPKSTSPQGTLRLSRLSGDAFDRAYTADMVRVQQEDVAAFQRESNTAHDRDIQDFATKTLATLREHLRNAQAMGPKRGGAAAISMNKPSPSLR